MLSDNNKLLVQQVEYWRGPYKKALMAAFEQMPEDKLDWTPAENMIPLGQVFLHICETSDWWYADIMKGKASVELAVRGQKCPPKADIAKHLDEHWQRLERFFAESPEILDKMYIREGVHEGRQWKIEKNGYWIFTHILEHDIHHRSQIFHYLRILGIKPPRA
ncbi:MAG: hypothetical protein CVT49_06200 [candidate division Zixibacteria bacterium HGW-Zixibacteria-1]|nr:MAG: hypothetical protein CVT49_06200 [candidate division Zixibacteria bacterium HGW-Zixibacteria-1]